MRYQIGDISFGSVLFDKVIHVFAEQQLDTILQL